MIRALALSAAAAVLVTLQAPPAPRPSGPPITIDFVALDKSGLPMMDLKPAEVEVWIGQFRAPIQTFTPITPESPEFAGRLIVLLLDDINLPTDSWARAADAAREFVTRLTDRDSMAIVTLSGIQLESSKDKAALLRAIDRYTVRATGVWRSDMMGRHFLEMLASISQSVIEAPGRRKTIVGIGQATIMDRPLPPPTSGQGDLVAEWVHAMRSMAFAKTNFYIVDPRGVGGSMVDGGDAGFARETGGHAFFGANDLKAAADHILRDASNYYVVTVPDPPVGAKADLRELNVKSLRKGVTIRSRHAIPGSF